jgi:hypothetical protein
MGVGTGGSLDRAKCVKENLTVHTQMSLVRVWTDTGNKKPSALLAKIIDNKPPVYVIRYLSKTDQEYKGCTVWRYEDDTYEVEDDSISEWLETDDELEVGFKTIGDEAFIFYDSDTDYVPSDDDDDDETTTDDDDDEEDAEEFSDDYDESEYDDE